jgi:DNA polymerase III psi subunit
MAINTRQFNYLSSMNIPLWQLKNNKNNTNITSNADEISSETLIATAEITPAPEVDQIDKQYLTSSVLFSDLLLALNIPFSSINITTKSIDLTLFTWQFLSSSAENLAISFDQKKKLLTSPSLQNIETSALLKKQLWSLISQNLRLPE